MKLRNRDTWFHTLTIKLAFRQLEILRLIRKTKVFITFLKYENFFKRNLATLKRLSGLFPQHDSIAL